MPAHAQPDRFTGRRGGRDHGKSHFLSLVLGMFKQAQEQPHGLFETAMLHAFRVTAIHLTTIL
jgi:hypothetical protein